MSRRCWLRKGWHYRRVAHRTEAKTDSRLAARLAALASFGASVIHFAVVPAHWQEWMPAGWFFTSVAVFQLGWARLVLARTTTPVLAVGITLNLGAIALWALSRTAGAPFGPHAGEAELVQAADLCALLLQIYVVMGAAWVWYRGLRGGPVPAFGSAVVLLGAVGVVALASTVGVASALRHGDHGPAAHADHHSHAEPAAPPPAVESVGTPAAPAPVQPPAPVQILTPVEVPPVVEPLEHGHADHDHGE